MKKSNIIIILAAILLALNLADIISTWIALSTGNGVEANPLVLLLGGPFSPAALLLKLVVIPGAILGVAWWIARQWKYPKLAMATVIMPAAVFAAAVANNVMVAAKKVEKTTKKVKKTIAKWT
jgi:Domain of unknown function (DUF5658)